MPDTEFDKDAITTSAEKLGALVDDISAFTNLEPHWPNAGAFSTAQWLERVVDDRRNGLVEHGQRLRIVLQALEENLKAVAEDFENADGENARRITGSFDDMEDGINEEIAANNTELEEDQRNWSEGDHGPGDPHRETPEEDAADGDGYDDNLDHEVQGRTVDPDLDDDDDDDDDD